MIKYSFYKIAFQKVSPMGVLFDENQAPRPIITCDEDCLTWLDRLLPERNCSFDMDNTLRGKGIVNHPCTIMAHVGRFSLLRIEYPKEVQIYEKKETDDGEAAQIDMRQMPSNPYVFAVFDCREGQGMLGISIDRNVWRKTDTVAAIVEKNINQKLHELNWGFHVSIKSAIQNVDFVSHSRYLIKSLKRRVTRMTIYFTHGRINPIAEAIIRSDDTLRRMMERVYNETSGELILHHPDTQSIIENNFVLLNHMAELVASEPVRELFRLKISYDNGVTYSCGKDVGMEFEMDEEVLLSAETGWEAWFNDVEKKIDEAKIDENATEQE